MKPKKFFSILFLLASNFCKAQETVVMDTSMFDKIYQTIELSGLNGWIFHEGNNLNWAAKNIDTGGWKKSSDADFSMKIADKNGKAEGWFRIKFKLDSSFANLPVTLVMGRWVAEDVYLDGSYIASEGNTGIDGKPYKEGQTYVADNHPVPVTLKPGIEYVLAMHVVDYPAMPLNPWKLKSGVNAWYSLTLFGPLGQEKNIFYWHKMSSYFLLYTSVCAALTLLFWFLYFQNKSEKLLLFIAVGMTFIFLQMLCVFIWTTVGKISFATWIIAYYGATLFGSLVFLFTTVVLSKIFKKKIQRVFLPFIILIAVLPNFGSYISLPSYTILLFPSLQLLFYLYLVISSWRNLKGAQWAVVAGIVSEFVFGLLFTYGSVNAQYWPWPHCYLLIAGIFLSFPLSLMMYVSMRFKEILNEVRSNANEVVRISEEKKQILANQNALLEQQVQERTKELKASQAQLIHSEKMASLGELTAGIAHEIQNPLNFVNNFSDLNKELAAELEEELDAGNYDDAKALASDIKTNEDKINHHGKRAQSIVTGMLQHSRSGKGEKQLTDINKLADEYLRLAYHGMRNKDKDFECAIETSFDESIGQVNIIPQEIGRVILNLVNNAFYAVNEKAKANGEDYKPAVTVTTKKASNSILLTVADNGNGIPEKIKEKIFQPFFTTKPTGQGTGLGLSLSYDIVKAHGGEIKAESTEGGGTDFIIQLAI